MHTCACLLMKTKKVIPNHVQSDTWPSAGALTGACQLANFWCLQNLAEIKGLSDAKIDKMVEAAKKCVTNFGWQTGSEVEKQVFTSCTD